jgi:hypothetical protein
MIATMTPVGMLAGAVLVGDALNTVTRKSLASSCMSHHQKVFWQTGLCLWEFMFRR